MNIQQMQYYREVCRWQNITRAAQELHIAQPTLSLAMQAIEQETGLNLFRHAGRNIRMTAEGEILYRQVERMLRQFARFESGIKTLARRHSCLQLALPAQLGTLILPLLLGEFRRQHPDIQLEITEPSALEALDMVEKEEADLAIVHDGDIRSGLTSRSLASWPVCLCLRRDHPWAGRASVTLAEAASLPLVMLGHNSMVTRKLLERFQLDHLQPEILHFSMHLSTIGIWSKNRSQPALSPAMRFSRTAGFARFRSKVCSSAVIFLPKQDGRFIRIKNASCSLSGTRFLPSRLPADRPIAL